MRREPPYAGFHLARPSKSILDEAFQAVFDFFGVSAFVLAIYLIGQWWQS